MTRVGVGTLKTCRLVFLGRHSELKRGKRGGGGRGSMLVVWRGRKVPKVVARTRHWTGQGWREKKEEEKGKKERTI